MCVCVSFFFFFSLRYCMSNVHSGMYVECDDSICPPSHQPDECGTRPFLRWVLHAPSIFKNASDPIDIPLKGVPQAPGHKPNPSEEG